MIRDEEGHRGRVRERFLRAGARGMSEYELIEILLFYAIPRRDVKPLAKELLRRFGTLEAVLSAEFDQLTAVKGIGRNAAVLLKLIPAIGVEILSSRQHGGITMDRPEKVQTHLLQHFAGCRDENFVLFLLDREMRLIDTVTFPGGIKGLTMASGDLLFKVLCRRRARQAIVAHNHPSGAPIPSRTDIADTVRLKIIFRGLGISLVDHFIVTPEKCVSLMKCSAEEGGRDR